MTRFFTLFCMFLLLPSIVVADEKDLTEDDYYPLVTFPIEQYGVLEIGALQLLPEGQLALGTRRGDIYIVENPFSENPEEVKLRHFAEGLHEILGFASRDGWLYVTQRCELSRLKDSSGDGKADLFETVNDGWGITGDYHEYAFGSKFDKEGNIWITLCLTGSFSSATPFRGWCVRITPDGKMIPTCGGIRSPGGMGMNLEGDVFYTDNQGPWNGTCSLKWLRPGSFQGHPGGNEWYKLATEEMGKTPREPKDQSRMMVEANLIPELEPPAVYFPYAKMGKSASGIACDITKGKFGPFAGQMFVGDQSDSTVMRCYMEKVEGHYQGACFPFRKGIASGTLPLEFSTDGKLFVGGTNRGWGSVGTAPFSLQRMQWNGEVPFEVLEMKALPDGFRFTFTQPISGDSALLIDQYDVETYTYIYKASYGSPEVDHTKPTIKDVTVSGDNLSIDVKLDEVQRGHVHEFHLKGIRSQAGKALLHDAAYYTLQYIPKK
ncbi:hypothetical protein Pla110_39040 [Polystyrenella longa]|uniref:DUF7133 domain-containing protein n=1 Tax=Polystyrenella longa TaxID=2528007 RepID=A0A518CSD0_9PLAN|nr:hypothetical protein [Polystyrenella longa]QDU82149.1 hypothetical protein Pla110_39040 [Polystyrenella longa]